MTPWWDNQVVRMYWEMQGFYRAGRRYRHHGRARALAITLWRGWR